MQNQLGTPNVIGELLDSHDNFKLKHEQLMRDFSRGRYMSREYAAKIQKEGLYTPKKDSHKLRATKKSEEPTKYSEQFLKKDAPNEEYNFEKVLKSMRLEQKNLYREMNSELKQYSRSRKLLKANPSSLDVT